MPDLVSYDNRPALSGKGSKFAQLIEGAFELGELLAEPFAGHCVLAQISICVNGDVEDVDVEMQFGRFAQFQHMLIAYREDRIRYSVRMLRSGPGCAADGDDLFRRERAAGIAPGIFGFVGGYGVICVRRHPLLECIAIQFC